MTERAGDDYADLAKTPYSVDQEQEVFESFPLNGHLAESSPCTPTRRFVAGRGFLAQDVELSGRRTRGRGAY